MPADYHERTVTLRLSFDDMTERQVDEWLEALVGAELPLLLNDGNDWIAGVESVTIKDPV